ncbi:MAG: hypothetical protein EON88_35575 [Brevundimonas sp.]|nr:MAG: hypothetical protein EON88_35575 [Brevundimonas sp.]
MDDHTTRMLAILERVDLLSADGRAGIGVLLAEIERRAPGAILKAAATVQIDRLGMRRAPEPPRRQAA